MSKNITLNVRVTGALGEYVASKVGEGGEFDNVSEYVRDLIRRDREREDSEAFERLRAELSQAFAAPASAYQPLTAADIVARAKRGRK